MQQTGETNQEELQEVGKTNRKMKQAIYEMIQSIVRVLMKQNCFQGASGLHKQEVKKPCMGVDGDETKIGKGEKRKIIADFLKEMHGLYACLNNQQSHEVAI